MKAIVAIDQNWAIGNKGKLLFRIPADLRNFKRLTMLNVIVMGRKTLDSLPNGRPLKDRVNLVLTSSARLESTEILRVFRDLDSLRDKIKTYPNDRVFVIGGESVYRQLLPYCDEVIVTKVPDTAPEADTFFPNLDKMPEWTQKGEPTWLDDEKYGKIPVITYVKEDQPHV